MIGKTVLVTGSNSGFGRLTAETLAKRGHRVFAGMRGVAGKNAAAAKELEKKAKAASWQLTVVELDVTDDASVNEAVRVVLARGTDLDTVINNAGVFGGGFAETFTPAQAEEMFAVNVFGVMRVNRAVLPHLRQRGGGLLVHVSSGLGRMVVPFASVYVASKFALEGLVESWRYELAPLGIEAVLVEPGAYNTGIGNKGMAPADPDRAAGYAAVQPYQERFFAGIAKALGPDGANPQEVADAMVKLVEAPAGARPIRTVVDAHPQGVQGLNAATDKLQGQAFSAMGLGDLLKTKLR